MSVTPLDGKRIVLGVTGSIAAYKAVTLASKLTQAGAVVETILTGDAGRFVSPITFQSVTGQPCYADSDLWGAQAHVLHVGLAQRADFLVIAPATAQTLAKLAQGLADNLLCLAALAATCPLLVAPAMDAAMFAHPATQANLAALQKRGATVVGPEEGHLASGLIARGRMTEPEELVGHIRFHLGRGGPLAGRKIVVTAGPTEEAIDPVRILTNRSTGKQGFAIAQAVLDAGGDVVLIAGPTTLPVPAGAQHFPVPTAEQMAEAVLLACREADALIMAAAVADFRPVQIAADKIKKAAGPTKLELERTRDILMEVAEQRREIGTPKVVVGFAAETRDVMEQAEVKLKAKHLDLIVANDVSASDSGFAVDTNRVVLLDNWGGSELLPLLSKDEVARRIVARILEYPALSGDREQDEPE